MSPNSKDVHVYDVAADGTVGKCQMLQKHDQLVAALDWAPKSDLLLSCGHDRDAYVWECKV